MTNDEVFTAGGLTMHSAGAQISNAIGGDTGELLYLSSTTRSGIGHPLGGGVPLVAPWFGVLWGRRPQHGYVRDEAWSLQVEGEQITGTLEHGTVRFDVRAASTATGFEIELTCTNQGEDAEKIQMGFHPYFLVDDVAGVEVVGLEGCHEFDHLNDRTGAITGPVRFEGEHDRIVTFGGTSTIVDAHRTITVSGIGTDSLVLWNPGPQKAGEQPDIGPDEWSRFVCVEPAVLGRELGGVIVEPGDSCLIGMRVAAELR